MATTILTKDILQHILSPLFPSFDKSCINLFSYNMQQKDLFPLIIYLITDDLADTIDTFQIVISQFLVNRQVLRTFCYIIFFSQFIAPQLAVYVSCTLQLFY